MICLQQRTIYCLKVFMLKSVKNSIFEMGASSTAKNQCIYFLHKKGLVIVTHYGKGRNACAVTSI